LGPLGSKNQFLYVLTLEPLLGAIRAMLALSPDPGWLAVYWESQNSHYRPRMEHNEDPGAPTPGRVRQARN